MDFEPRDTIDNQYKVIEKHQGGMSTVYIVLDEFSQRRFAIKTVREDLLENRSAHQRFTQEAQMWMNLGRHPHVVEAIIYREIDGQPFLFLEYVDGGDVQKLLDRERRIFVPQFLTFALQVCDAMEYIHKVPLGGGNRGIIHRDLKPANLMLSRKCEIKIADFGLSKIQGAATGDVDPGKGLGTYLYMPPEQFLDAASADRTSDVYAFGVAMYLALVGKPPFEASSVGALAHTIMNQMPPSPTRINPDVPPELSEVVLRCMAKARQDRFPNFAALTAALNDARPAIEKHFEGRAHVWRCTGCGYQTLFKYIVCPVCAGTVAECRYGEALPPPPAEPEAPAASAGPSEADVVATLLQRATVNYHEGRLPQALSLLRQVLSMEPEHAEATALLDRVALDLARQKAQTSTKSYNWPMFRGNVTRSAYTPEVVPPPLSLAWRARVGNWTMCSPAVSDGIVYIGGYVERPGQTGRFCAFSQSDGQLVWAVDASHEIVAGACVIARKLVCFPFQHRMAALNIENGAKVWELRTNDLVGSSPAYWQDSVYFGSGDGNVYAANAETGALTWTFAAEMEVMSSPAVWEGHVYVGSADNKLYCLSASTGMPIWEFMTGAEIYGAPAVLRDRVFVGSADHRLYCLDAKTGRRAWEFQTGGEIHGSPAVVAGAVFIGSRDRRLYAIDAERGECKWHFTTGDWVESSPAISGRTVYFGSHDGKVYGLEIETGVCLWEYKTDGEVKSSPAASGGRVFIGSNDGYLYCFRAR